MKVKKRLDVLLVELGYAETRTKAQAIIMSGQVYVGGQKADKPGTSYEETVEISGVVFSGSNTALVRFGTCRPRDASKQCDPAACGGRFR